MQRSNEAENIPFCAKLPIELWREKGKRTGTRHSLHCWNILVHHGKANRLKDELSSEADCGLFGCETAWLISSQRPQVLVRPSAREDLGSASRSVHALEWVCSNCEWRRWRMCWTLITVAVLAQGHALRWRARTLEPAHTLSRSQHRHRGPLGERIPDPICEPLLTGHSTRTVIKLIKQYLTGLDQIPTLKERIETMIHSRIWLNEHNIYICYYVQTI